MLRSLVFDWSGTLCDDVGLTHALTNETLARFGGEGVDFGTYRREFRAPVDLFYGPRLPETPMAEIDAFFFRRYGEEATRGHLFPFVPFILKYARMNDLRLFICTTLPAGAVESLLRRAGVLELFEHIEGRAFDKRLALPALIGRFGLAPDETLFIGDMANDLAAAHAARCRAGAAMYGYGESEALEAERPDRRFESPRALFDWLQATLAGERYARPIATVGGLIYNPRGEILLIRTKKWSDLYGVPGGKIEYGETAADAFRREVWEETGLEVRDVEFVSFDEGIENPEFRERRHFLFVNFRARADSSEVRGNYEAWEWRWVAPEQALALALNQPTRALLDLEVNG